MIRRKPKDTKLSETEADHKVFVGSREWVASRFPEIEKPAKERPKNTETASDLGMLRGSRQGIASTNPNEKPAKSRPKRN